MKRGVIPDTWLLLDSQSTCGVECNRNLLKNIVPCDPAVMHSQGGENILNQKGMLGSIECYLYEGGIANIMSLAELQAKYKTTFDSSRGNCFVVHLPCGRKLHFEQSPKGLYYHDLAEGGFEDVALSQIMTNAQGSAAT